MDKAYEYLKDVPDNLESAKSEYYLGCIYDLGIYNNGRRTLQDRDKAREMLRRAARHGNEAAKEKLKSMVNR